MSYTVGTLYRRTNCAVKASWRLQTAEMTASEASRSRSANQLPLQARALVLKEQTKKYDKVGATAATSTASAGKRTTF